MFNYAPDLKGASRGSKSLVRIVWIDQSQYKLEYNMTQYRIFIGQFKQCERFQTLVVVNGRDKKYVGILANQTSTAYVMLFFMVSIVMFTKILTHDSTSASKTGITCSKDRMITYYVVA